MAVEINYFGVTGFAFPVVIGGGDGTARLGPKRLEYSPAEIVQQLLINHGMGTVGGAGGVWPIFSTNEPDEPDNCITVYDTTGGDEGRIRSGEVQGPWGIQIRLRSSQHRIGIGKANQLWVEIAEEVRLENVTLSWDPDLGSIVYQVWSFGNIGNVLAIGKDSSASKRSLFTINAFVNIRKRTSS